MEPSEEEELSDGSFKSLETPQKENEHGLLETHLVAVQRQTGLEASATYNEGAGFSVRFDTYPTESELNRAASVLSEKGYDVATEQDTLLVTGWSEEQ